jgi:hypothetical protein
MRGGPATCSELPLLTEQNGKDELNWTFNPKVELPFDTLPRSIVFGPLLARQDGAVRSKGEAERRTAGVSALDNVRFLLPVTIADNRWRASAQRRANSQGAIAGD